MSLSLVAVPVILDTNTQASHLLVQFVRLYHYGHQLMPSLAVATFLLYGYTAIKNRSTGGPWKIQLLAGLTTLTMVPFTWIAMTPTNNSLFELHEQSKATEAVELRRVQRLLIRWGVLHVVRSLFPLGGAILGGTNVLQQFGF
jgi:anthrone oxygenase-like protein